MKKNTNILWGLLLVGVGVIVGLNAFEITNFDLFFDGWWTLFIIVPSFISLFSAKDKTASIIGLCVGGLLLLVCRDILTYELLSKLAMPVILVVIGLCLIFKNSFSKAGNREAFRQMQNGAGNLPEYGGVFSSKNVNFNGQPFVGADITAAFGSFTLNGENAFVDNDCLINCTATFGGIDIYLPTNVNVVVRATSIFGGVSDKRASKAAVPGPTVYVNALCLFGGVDIK